MANDNRKPATQPPPPQGGSGTAPVQKSRSRDAEQLAATIFAQTFLAARGGRTPEHLAREALDAARAFYDHVDAPPG